MEGYAVYSGIIAKEDKGHIIRKHLLEVAEEMNGIDDCKAYIVGVDPQSDDALFVYEVWKTKESHDASLQLPIYQVLRDGVRPHILTVRNFPTVKFIAGHARFTE